MGTAPKKKSEVKKLATKKKVVAKAPAIKKTVVKKPVVKKGEAKSTASKQKNIKLKSATKKSSPSKRVATKSEAKGDSATVLIPQTVSLRLLEKAEIYRLWYKENFPTYMSTVSRVGGYAFILLGVSFATVGYISSANLSLNSAALVCSDSSCTDIPDSELPPGSPLVTFINKIPEQLTTNVSFSILASNAPQVNVYITKIENGRKTELTQSQSADGSGNATYVINYNSLTSGTYVLSAEVVSGGSTYKFKGSSFSVSSNKEEVLDESDQELDEDVEEEVGLDLESTMDQASTSEATTSEQITSSTSDDSLVSLRLEKLNDSVFLKLRTGNFTPNLVEIYAQSQNTDDALFLGLATLVQGEWIFSLNALDLPATKQLIFASFIADEQTYKSKAVSYVPNVPVMQNTEAIEADSALLVKKVDLALETMDMTVSNRNEYFSYFLTELNNTFSKEDEEEFLNSSLLERISEKMKSNEDELNILFANYAFAVQTGLDFTIRLAEIQLEKYAAKLATEIASENTDLGQIPAIKTVLAMRFNVIKGVVGENEEQIKTETNDLTSKDVDEDGVSNYDEFTHFNSSSVQSDSDLDGVIDSVEIFTFSDPNTAERSEFVSLKQTIDDVYISDALEITAVTPLIVRTSDVDDEVVQAVIQGKGIPNTFTYIASYELGVVGIVKTSSNGSFSYTLEKNLANDRYSVFAALADQSGKAIAVSKPFKFSRSMKSQSAASVESSNVSFTDTDESSSTLPQVVTAAVGVVAFGLILLLLSFSLRNRRKEEEGILPAV